MENYISTANPNANTTYPRGWVDTAAILQSAAFHVPGHEHDLIFKNLPIDLTCLIESAHDVLYGVFIVNSVVCRSIAGMPDHMKMARFILEIFPEYMPDYKFLNPDLAWTACCNTLKEVWTTLNMFGKLSVYYTLWRNSRDASVTDAFPAVYSADDMPAFLNEAHTDAGAKAMAAFIKGLGFYAQSSVKSEALTAFYSFPICVCKVGSVTDRFLEKLGKGIGKNMGESLLLNSIQIKALWTELKEYVNDENACSILNRWENYLPCQKLRVKHIMEAGWGPGLTTFAMIMRAYTRHPKFNWANICRLFPNDVENFKIAKITVGNNKWYGLKRDLGPVRSIHFKNLAFIAKELLIQAGGETALKGFLGLPTVIQYMDQIQKMIDDYTEAMAYD